MEKKHDNVKSFDSLSVTPAFYVFLGVCLLTLVFAIVMLVLAGRNDIRTTDEVTIKNVNAGNYAAPEHGDLADYFDGYKDFKSHDDYVVLGESPNPTESPEPTQTVFETETPTITPNPTEAPTVRPTHENGIAKYNLFERYANEPDTVIDKFKESIKVGDLIIDNSYGADGFDLKEVLKTDLEILKNERLDWPRVVLVSTFAGEGYSLTDEDKKIGVLTDGYNTPQSITERAKVLEASAEKLGVGVARRGDINDKVPELAYETSSSLAKKIADDCTTCELSIDLQRTAFEYPVGEKYAPTVTKDGKKYAMVRFIVSQNEETNPNWRENVKFVTLLVEKLSVKVPGISLGIQLSPDGKFNTQATKYGLLIELGYEGNLVTEADNTAALLGETIAEIYLGK